MKKNISRALSLFLVLVMVLGAMPIALADGFSVTITGATTAEVGDTVSLTASVAGELPEGALVAYQWDGPTSSISNTYEFVTTEAGNIPVSVTVTIMDAQNNLLAEVDDTKVIVVTEPESENFITLSASSLELVPGQSRKLTATTYPTDTTVTWVSSDPSVATVSGGNVTAKSVSGTKTAVITATTAEGEVATCDVTVTGNVVVLDTTRAKQTLEMSIGDETFWGLTFRPTNAPAYITYSSSNPSVVYIDNAGNVSARKAGTATVTATLKLDGSYESMSYTLGTPSVVTCEITVGGSTYISCDNETSDGSYIMLEPVLYHNGYVVSNAEFYYTHTSGIEVYTSNNETFSVEPGNKESGTVTFTLKSASYNGVAINPADVPSKTVSVSFCETASLQVEVKDGISSFQFDDTGIAAAASYGYYSSTSVSSSKLYTYSLMDLIGLAMPDYGYATIDAYEFSVKSSSGGELTAPTGGNSNWTTGNKRVSSYYVETVGFRQKSTTNPTTTFTISAIDNNVAVAAVDVTIIAGETSGIKYETTYNKSVTFDYRDFQDFWNSNRTTSSSTLSYVYFNVSNTIPAYGDLYTTTAQTTEVTRSMKFVPSTTGTGSGSSKTYPLSSVTYKPSSLYSSSYTVEIPFTATGTRNDTLTGYVIIELNGSGSTIGARGTTLGDNVAANIASTYRSATGKTLGYVVFTLPSAQQATLYRSIPSVGGYSRVTEAQKVLTGDRFYYNASSSGINYNNNSAYNDYYNNNNSNYYGSELPLASVGLIPAASYAGTISLKYTAYSSAGSNAYSGTINYTVQTKNASAVFSDVTATKYSWASDAVDFLYYEGTAQGSNGKYNPSANITRGDFMLMLYRAFLEEDYSTHGVTSNFDDMVKGNTTYSQETYQAVGVAKYLGIAQGTNNKFNPKANITREEAMVLIYRTLEKLNRSLRYSTSTKASSFSDFSSISGWASSAISDLVSHGVIQGSNNRITPKANITRAEMACILHRVITY